jgi:hypothetical protein
MKKLLAMALIILVSFAFIGCGGDDSPSTVTYTGSTTQATVTSSNAEEIMTTAFESAAMAGDMAGGAAENIGGSSKAVMLAKNITMDLFRQAENAKAAQTVTNTVSGQCGGTMTYTVTVDDVALTVSGTFTYSNYNDCEDTINGVMILTGSMTGQEISFTITISNFVLQSSTDYIGMNGTVTMTGTPDTSFTMTMDLEAIDYNTNETIKIEDYNLSITSSGINDSITVSGTFYHSDFGYVTLSTPTPLVMPIDGDHPISGVMVVRGANSGARLTASGTTYTIDVDADGDGTYELGPLTGTW